jgi:hypothetical protein
VTNTGELPLHGIRLLGESRKREDQIGQFGTGLKEAIALSTRLGTDLVIHTGHTEIGFAVEGSPEEVMFYVLRGGDGGRYSDGTSHPMNISPQFGHHDWVSAWQLLREVVCNALDEGLTQFDLVPAPGQPVPGQTTVYVRLTPQLLEAYKQLPTRLLGLSKPTALATVPGVGTIYSPLEVGTGGKLYHKGVFVQAWVGQSIFDYDLSALLLTESRSVDWYSAYSQVAAAICGAPQEIIQQFITGVCGGGRVMEQHLSTWDFPVAGGPVARKFTDAFKSLHGADAVAVSTRHQAELVTKAGKTPIQVPEFFYGVMKRLGAATIAQEIQMASDDGITRGPATPAQQKTFDHIWQKLENARLTRGKHKPPLLAFTKIGTDGNGKLHGFYDRKSTVVYISHQLAGSAHERSAMIEEICHYITLADDLTRDFQNWCMEAIDALMS